MSTRDCDVFTDFQRRVAGLASAMGERALSRALHVPLDVVRGWMAGRIRPSSHDLYDMQRLEDLRRGLPDIGDEIIKEVFGMASIAEIKNGLAAADGKADEAMAVLQHAKETLSQAIGLVLGALPDSHPTAGQLLGLYRQAQNFADDATAVLLTSKEASEAFVATL